MKHPVRLGIEKLLTERIDLLRGARVGLICNQASVDHGLQHAADLFHANAAVNLKALFGPQHGIRGDVQDNMIETGHSGGPAIWKEDDRLRSSQSDWWSRSLWQRSRSRVRIFRRSVSDADASWDD